MIRKQLSGTVSLGYAYIANRMIIPGQAKKTLLAGLQMMGIHRAVPFGDNVDIACEATTEGGARKPLLPYETKKVQGLLQSIISSVILALFVQ